MSRGADGASEMQTELRGRQNWAGVGGTRDSYPLILVHNSESEHYEVEQGFLQGSPVGTGPLDIRLSVET